MLQIILAILIFTSVVVYINGFGKRSNGVNYDQDMLFAISVLGASSILLFLIGGYWPILSPSMLLPAIVVGLYYLLVQYASTKPIDTTRYYKTVPVHAREIVRLTYRSVTTKCFEIFFQNVVLFTIVSSLIMMDVVWPRAAILLSIVAFLTHVLGLKWFGKFYGVSIWWDQPFLFRLLCI